MWALMSLCVYIFSFEIEPELLLPKHIAHLVKSSGEFVNIADVSSDPRCKNIAVSTNGLAKREMHDNGQDNRKELISMINIECFWN